MRRRDLLGLFGVAIASWPRLGIAQQPKLRTIGILAVDSLATKQFRDGFREAMRGLGYLDGQNIRFELRSDPGNGDHLPELAAELVRLKVDVIVTWLTPAATAAKQATRDIPIVMGSAGNPVETGLVESLARPGGNVTGIAGNGAERAGKIVELVREILPSVRRIAVLADAPDPFAKQFLEQIRRAGEATRTRIDPIMVNSAEELEAAFPAMRKDPPDALIVQANIASKRAAELALRYRMPAACTRREFVDQGGLMTYAVDDALAFRRAAVFVDKILKGAKPADLPVEQPTKFELVINLKTAKALGLTVPPSLLARADEVIE
jgi:putative ABC transport system substrate-binding protein